MRDLLALLNHCSPQWTHVTSDRRVKPKPLSKVCRKCKVEKPASEFGIRSDKQCLRYCCKACDVLKVQAWRRRK